MSVTEKCSSYLTNLKEFSRDLTNRYMTRRISFYDRDIADTLYSLGYVETVTHQDGEISILSSDDTDDSCCSTFILTHNNYKTKDEPPKEISKSENANNSKYETLEMQLIQTPKRNYNSSYTNRRIKLGQSAPNTSVNRDSNLVSIPVKYSPPKTSMVKFKNLLEPRKYLYPYKVIGSEGDEHSQFRHPLGVAVSPIDGSMYVCDSWNNRLLVLDEQGSFLKCIDRVGEIVFHYPYSIHADRKGRIYVSDQSLIRIKVFDNQFNLIRVIGKYGRETGCFSGLCDISTDKENNIYICDSGNHRIIKFNENGEFILQWGSNGSADGFFKCPACVTIHEDRVFISDWGNHRYLYTQTSVLFEF
jgi:DNA-binding beta-propeller fold protein YncE